MLGGGYAEMLMSCTVENEAFSQALTQIRSADNTGYDSSDLVSRLRAAHYGHSEAGLEGATWQSN